MSGRSNATIKDLKVKGFTEGIRLYMASSSTIYGNNVGNNKYGITPEHSSSNNCIRGNNVTNNQLWGVNLYESSKNNGIVGNNVADNWEDGISLDMSSSNNSIQGNSVADNRYGIRLWYSLDNNAFRNDVTNNGYGIYLRESSNNIFYHNNFDNNTQQIYDYSWSHAETTISINAWDNGYPSGGNYWSDHATNGDYSGVNQDEPGSDGIADEPYIIDDDNCDNYPLVEPWSPLPRTIGELKNEIEKCWSEGEIDNQGIVKSLIAKLNGS